MKRLRLPVSLGLIAGFLAPLLLTRCAPTEVGNPDGDGTGAQPWNRQLEGFDDARYGNFPQSQ